MDLNLNGIPEELKKYLNWVNWSIKERDGKPAKIPINPKTGGQAKTNNPRTWGSFEQAARRWEECENGGIKGLGFVLSDGYSGVDLDKCRNPETGELEVWAKEVISQLDSYSEITPSGKGIHVLTKGKLPPGGRRKGNFEMYDRDRFFTVTGQHLGGTPMRIERREAELGKVHEKYLNHQPNPPVTKLEHTRGAVDLTNSDILKEARQARNGEKFERLWVGDWTGYDSRSEGDLALCLILAFWTAKDAAKMDQLFRQSGLMREKWDEQHFSDGQTYGVHTIAKAIDQTIEVYTSPKKNVKGKDQAIPSSNELKNETYEVGINLTDLGNTRRFIAAHGKDLHYCYPWGKWLSWDGQRWIVDDVGEVTRRAKATISLIYKEAAAEKDKDRRKALGNHALRCESDAKLKAIVELAKSEPGIPILPKEMDRHPWLLNVVNGTINLLAGTLCPHERDHLITKLAPVEFRPDQDCPYWKEHLQKIMNGNQDLIAFLQRGYGHTLTGVTDERIIMIQHGSGANGKTTSNEVIAMCMGDYAVRTPTETLLVKREGSIPNDLAKLKGARFVFCSEADEGKRLGESLIKDLTGGDTIAARFMRGEWFEFRPTFKIWLATNHKPIIRGTDNAIWDRIRLIPFIVSIPEEERIPRREMMPRFEEELSGILTWMVKGCMDWQRTGLGTPKEVKEATGKYREEMDLIGEFIKECCVVSKTEEASKKDLYEKYCEWAEVSGERPIKKKEFGTRLVERGFSDGRGTGGARQWEGIGLKK